jgi:hypothetical protein
MVMEATQHLCHRCASLLPEQALYCPQCGAPQLLLSEADAQRIAAELAAAPAAGTQPPPRAPGSERIRWRPALRIVAAVALAAGVAAALGNVASILAFIGSLLVFLAPTLCISFYQRKVPGARMGVGVGARIGLALGILMSVVLTLVNTASLLVMRYPRHTGAQMDQDMNSQAQQVMTQVSQAYPNLYGNAQQTMYWLRYMQSPDGHATLMLIRGAFVSCTIIFYSVIFGAMLGWLRPVAARRRTV